MQEKDKFYTTEELAERLKVSERSVRDSLNSGELKGYKRFNKWYVFEEDLIKFLKKGEVKK